MKSPMPQPHPYSAAYASNGRRAREGAGFAIGDRRRARVQQVVRRSRQLVEPNHHQHVAGLEPVDDAVELQPVGLGSACTSRNTLPAPVLPQSRDLNGDALADQRAGSTPLDDQVD